MMTRCAKDNTLSGLKVHEDWKRLHKVTKGLQDEKH